MWEIKTLGRADDERAREMLEKTAWQVQPIMRKRGWKVQELCEMKPEQRDRVGDNLNMGQRVRLKLRKNNSGDWFDYDHVVLVMLHELCHNDIGPEAWAVEDARVERLREKFTRLAPSKAALYDTLSNHLGFDSEFTLQFLTSTMYTIPKILK